MVQHLIAGKTYLKQTDLLPEHRNFTAVDRLGKICTPLHTWSHQELVHFSSLCMTCLSPQRTW